MFFLMKKQLFFSLMLEFIRILSLKSFGCKRKQNIGCSRGFFSHFTSKFNDLLNVAIVSTTLCQKRRFFNLKLHNKNHITPRALHLFFLMIKSYTLSLGLVQGTTWLLALEMGDDEIYHTLGKTNLLPCHLI